MVYPVLKVKIQVIKMVLQKLQQVFPVQVTGSHGVPAGPGEKGAAANLKAIPIPVHRTSHCAPCQTFLLRAATVAIKSCKDAVTSNDQALVRKVYQATTQSQLEPLQQYTFFRSPACNPTIKVCIAGVN